ncbi:hypothetical protein MLD38_006029 [Melastoma candidum]|uniref:Uncharacterized protein n=1 Tax=Melastoma candidum TaxID=119954 RepID=A0ACB9RPN4_9MYRT|nr:hypothetical protein MLD38_006029 [Melastoma candidum]
MKLAKKGWVYPGQSSTIFDVSPFSYTFEVQAMSSEKLPFVLSAVFTICLEVEEQASLIKYARLISLHNKGVGSSA